jgi:hypothetical protein
MRNLLFWIVVTNLFWVEAAIADNNDTSTVSVGGKVVASLQILGVTQNLKMPDVVLPDTGETTTVELTCPSSGANTVIYDNRGGNPFADGTADATAVGNGTPTNSLNTAVGDSAGACASLVVQGEPDFFYIVTSNISNPVMATGVTLNTITCDASSSGKLTFGFGTVTCGGKVTVDDSATAVNYNGSADVIVTYD